MECGGVIKTYLPCRDEKHLMKKLKKRHDDGVFDFGHFRVFDDAVMYAGFKFHEVH